MADLLVIGGDAPMVPWHSEAAERLSTLQELGDNWDGWPSAWHTDERSAGRGRRGGRRGFCRVSGRLPVSTFGERVSISQIFAVENLHIQRGDSNCGPVTLLNVLAMQGDHSRTENELADLCQTQPGFGTSNEMMVAAAKQLGMEIVAVQEDAAIGDLERHIDDVAHVIVCYLSLSASGHYSIVSEYDDKALYLHDCCYGLIRIEKETFEARWRNLDEPAERWFMATR